MERIGVFICHCKLMPPVDTEKISEAVGKKPGVAYVAAYEDMCIAPGLEQIKDAIKSERLDGVLLTSCSPALHEEVFRHAVTSAGLEGHQMAIIDIRSQNGIKETTQRAIEAIESALERLQASLPTTTVRLPIQKRALVIGGGVAGIRAALDIADGGYEVILVEKTSSIGGHMIQLSETFPTLDCPQCIETPWMVECGQHPNIKIMAYSEVESVSGEIGNFHVTIKRKASYVDWDKCTGCGECSAVCPVELYSDFQRGTAPKKAISKPFAQAIPNKVVIDKSGIAPCRAACPLHVNAQGYVSLISKGKFAEALKLVREQNPLPGICGRVCTHPCESACKRGELDKPLAIRELKRVVADYEKEMDFDLSITAPEKEEKIAIIGAGPAGLMAAYELRKMGYKPTIFEALPFAGGMMRVGIPEYRLPRDIMDKEIGIIEKMGVEIKLNTTIGKEITLDDLRRDFKAIFIAIGTYVSAKLGVPGEELAGVVHGIDFLKKVNLGEKAKVGDRVAIVGGGNVAIDAARCAYRLGAKEVFIIYRRSRTEMPASPEEIEEAEREGVTIHYLATPVRILSDDGKVSGMECIKMMLGEPDESGRRRPIPIEGSEFTIDVDMVIPAIGQSPDLFDVGEIKLKRNNTFEVDPLTLQASEKGIFAGGDVVTGPNTVIDAMAAGRKAAISIDRYIKGEDLTIGREWEGPQESELEVNLEGIAKKDRVVVPTLSLEEREKNFAEVEMCLSEEAAVEEASRCLSCPGCCECLTCETACEVKAIDHSMVDKFEEVDVGAIVVATGYDLLPKREIEEFEQDPDIIDGIQFERILCPSGPTNGVVLRPSDSSEPKEVVFVSCVGSRDPEHGLPYCSRVCCMYLVKMAMLYKHAVHDGHAYIFYMDIRTTGKGYEEFVQRAVEEDNVLYLRGRVSKVFRDGDKIMVWGADTLTGKKVEISADLVVLATCMIASPGAKELASKLGIATDEYGFMAEIHPKLRPLESTVPGIYLAGTAQGPKDIPDSVAHAGGAASKALELFSKDELLLERTAT
jgi:heterodisulfide reductase subunit A